MYNSISIKNKNVNSLHFNSITSINDDPYDMKYFELNPDISLYRSVRLNDYPDIESL